MSGVLEQAKKFESYILVLVSLIGSWAFLATWWSEQVVSKEEWLMGNTETNLRLVQSEIGAYQRYGLDKLTDGQRHKYENLIKAEEKLSCTRDKFLGITDEC